MQASVIIPAYNCEDIIERTLDALVDQDFEEDYDVIVVDDGSTDGTKEVVENYAEGEEKVKLVKQENAGPAAARNTGADEAEGKYLLFTDSDCVPESNWISEMVSSLEREGVIGVQGRYRCLNKDSLLARFIQYEIEERYERMEKDEYIDFVGSYSAGYRKDEFMEVGGFDEEFKRASGEDPDLSYRLDEKGYKMVFNQEAIVKHKHPEDLKTYKDMNFGRGYWGVKLYRKNPEKRSGHSYNSLSYFLKIPFTLGLLGTAAIASPFVPQFSGLALLFLFLMHIHTSLYAGRHEKKFLAIGPLLLSFKFLFIGLGIIKGYIDF